MAFQQTMFADLTMCVGWMSLERADVDALLDLGLGPLNHPEPTGRPAMSSRHDGMVVCALTVVFPALLASPSLPETPEAIPMVEHIYRRSAAALELRLAQAQHPLECRAIQDALDDATRNDHAILSRIELRRNSDSATTTRPSSQPRPLEPAQEYSSRNGDRIAHTERRLYDGGAVSAAALPRRRRGPHVPGRQGPCPGGPQPLAATGLRSGAAGCSHG